MTLAALILVALIILPLALIGLAVVVAAIRVGLLPVIAVLTVGAVLDPSALATIPVYLLSQPTTPALTCASPMGREMVNGRAVVLCDDLRVFRGGFEP